MPLFSAYGGASQQNNIDSDSISLTDEFGSLSLNEADVIPYSSSELPSATGNAIRLNYTIPTTVSRGVDPLIVSVQNYFDSLDGGYDISGILYDFSEANKDHPEPYASHWLSALDKPPNTSAKTRVEFIGYSENRPVRKPVGLRQKHLLARWRAANRKAACRKSNLKPRLKLGDAEASQTVDEVEGQNGLLLCSTGSVGAGAVSSRVHRALEDSLVTSFGLLGEESMRRYAENVSSQKASPVIKEERIEEHHGRRDRFDPLDVRAKISSVEALSSLTYAKDIEGLRATLNEYRWPSIQSVRPFINDLLKVFIDQASDVDEIKFLMWDFAATDNRAFVADSVTLLLLERIVREEGLQSATTYAKQHRDLFLVRPPMERNKPPLQQLYSQLFTTVINVSASSLANARAFVDLLIDLGYLENDHAFFLFSLTEELRRSGFEAGFQLWSSFVRQYRSSDGMHLLLRAIVSDMNLHAQQKCLSKLLELSLQFNHPYAALAELIVELVIANRLNEAEVLLKKLTISGHHLRAPLARLKEDPANLVVIERIGELVTNCLFAEKKAKVRKKAAKQLVLNSDTLKFVDSVSASLISKWTPHKKKKFNPPNQKAKRFVLDPEQMQALNFCVQDVWSHLAGLSSDTPSLERLHTWCLKNNVEIERKIIKRCQEIYSKNGQPCPFVEEAISS